MLGFRRRAAREAMIGRFHASIVDASRAAALYGPGGLPDTLDGRFESLTLHVLIVLRRLGELPPPADEVAQELIDAFFAHLEVALRESGVGDFGVPKRMKKLGTAFYDRTSRYDVALAEKDEARLARGVADRLSAEPETLRRFARYCLDAEAALGTCDLHRLLAGPPFAPVRELAA